MKNYTNINQFTTADIKGLSEMTARERHNFVKRIKITNAEKDLLFSYVANAGQRPKASLWQRAKRVAKNVVSKTVGFFKAVGRKTAQGAKFIARNVAHVATVVALKTVRIVGKVARIVRHNWLTILVVSLLAWVLPMLPFALLVALAILTCSTFAFLFGVIVMYAVIRNEVQTTGQVPAWVFEASGNETTAHASN